jgi:signal transduction histidine kinase
LGLYIVREILVAHEGRVTVESVEGQGTTFTFTFPAP